MKHQLEIVRTRQLDNSLVWRCGRCKKVGVALDGPCAAYGPRGRKPAKEIVMKRTHYVTSDHDKGQGMRELEMTRESTPRPEPNGA